MTLRQECRLSTGGISIPRGGDLNPPRGGGVKISLMMTTHSACCRKSTAILNGQVVL